jgi:hypothetical protein
MARIIETARGKYKILGNENGAIAVSVCDNKDVYDFDEKPDELSDKDIRDRIEEGLINEEFDAEFLNDDFSWVNDFQQW